MSELFSFISQSLHRVYITLPEYIWKEDEITAWLAHHATGRVYVIAHQGEEPFDWQHYRTYDREYVDTYLNNWFMDRDALVGWCDMLIENCDPTGRMLFAFQTQEDALSFATRFGGVA